MSGDHYIPQGYLRQWLIGTSEVHLNAATKIDPKEIRPKTQEVCRRKNHSTNKYLAEPRFIEEVLKKFEPSLGADIAAVMQDGLTRKLQKKLSLFIAFLRIFTPSAIRVEAARAMHGAIAGFHENQTGPVEHRIAEYVKETETFFPIKYLREDGAIWFSIDNDKRREIQANRVNQFDEYVNYNLERHWQVIRIECDGSFLTSDNPIISMDSVCGKYGGIFFPLNPKLGIWLSEKSFGEIGMPHSAIDPLQIVGVGSINNINEQIVRFAESVVIQHGADGSLIEMVRANENFRMQFCMNLDDGGYRSGIRAVDRGLTDDGFRAVIVDEGDAAPMKLGSFKL